MKKLGRTKRPHEKSPERNIQVPSNMARNRSEWVYDELLNYVASPLFQAPVVTFMEANCLSKYWAMLL